MLMQLNQKFNVYETLNRLDKPVCQFRTLSVTQCCKLHHHVTRSSVTHNRYMYAIYVMNYLYTKLEDKWTVKHSFH